MDWACSKCGQVLDVLEEHLDSTVVCPGCGNHSRASEGVSGAPVEQSHESSGLSSSGGFTPMIRTVENRQSMVKQCSYYTNGAAMYFWLGWCLVVVGLLVSFYAISMNTGVEVDLSPIVSEAVEVQNVRLLNNRTVVAVIGSGVLVMGAVFIGTGTIGVGAIRLFFDIHDDKVK